MKNFLRKRWHGLPIGILAMVLMAGVVAAAGFTFLSGTVDVSVDEACEIQTWDGSAWQTRGEGFSITVTDVYPGESFSIPMQVVNKSSATLTVAGTYAMTVYPAGGYGNISVSGGFSAGISCATGITRDDLTLTASNDAPPGGYTFTLDFNRS